MEKAEEKTEKIEYDPEKIKSYWKRYVEQGEEMPEHLEGLRDPILQSWKRSRKKVNPFERRPVLLNHKELQQLTREKSDLIQIAVPYMIQFYEIAKDTTQNVLLTDEQGKQLKNISADDEELLDLMDQVSVTNGSDYGEDACGTSGVSLCLYEDAPVLLRGYEHYQTIYHDLACFSMPIHSLGNKQVGCICITGPLDKYRPFIASACKMMIHAIENELHFIQTDMLMQVIVQNLSQGFLVLNAKKKILKYNQKACECLGISGELAGGQFQDFFLNDFDEIAKIGMKYGKNRFRYVLTRKNQSQIALSMMLVPICENNREDLYILIFNTADETNRERGKLLGYRRSGCLSDLCGASEEISRVKELGMIAAKNASCVLIRGESGTGRELLAQAIHNESDRKDHSFITVRCGSVPREWMETELFGDKTGNQVGRLELADRGTLFLEEVDQLSMECQIRLVDFLDTKTADNRKNLDVRIIACTQKDLFQMTAAGTFRMDLYYKLNVINILIPPLRQRRKDIQPLIQQYISRYRKILKKEVTSMEKQCMEVLLNYSWPGNVRELESVIERLVNLAKGPVICFSDLPEELVSAYYTQRYTGDHETQLVISPEDREYGEIVRCLKQVHGHVKTAAGLLDMPLSTLYRKCEKYKIDPKMYRQWQT